MEAQTLQQQTPVYHVCQQCNGAGCQACSDLLILDGDIQLDPEWVDELPEPSPINGVIGITPSVNPDVIQVAHCTACSFIGATVEFDIINYVPTTDLSLPDLSFLICPVCGEEFR